MRTPVTEGFPSPTPEKTPPPRRRGPPPLKRGGASEFHLRSGSGDSAGAYRHALCKARQPSKSAPPTFCRRASFFFLADPARAQRSGSCGERRSSGASEPCRFAVGANDTQLATTIGRGAVSFSSTKKKKKMGGASFPAACCGVRKRRRQIRLTMKIRRHRAEQFQFRERFEILPAYYTSSPLKFPPKNAKIICQSI